MECFAVGSYSVDLKNNTTGVEKPRKCTSLPPSTDSGFWHFFQKDDQVPTKNNYHNSTGTNIGRRGGRHRPETTSDISWEGIGVRTSLAAAVGPTVFNGIPQRVVSLNQNWLSGHQIWLKGRRLPGL